MIYEPVLKDGSVVFSFMRMGLNLHMKANTSCFQILVIFEESILGNLVRP